MCMYHCLLSLKCFNEWFTLQSFPHSTLCLGDLSMQIHEHTFSWLLCSLVWLNHSLSIPLHRDNWVLATFFAILNVLLVQMWQTSRSGIAGSYVCISSIFSDSAALQDSCASLHPGFKHPLLLTPAWGRADKTVTSWRPHDPLREFWNPDTKPDPCRQEGKY